MPIYNCILRQLYRTFSSTGNLRQRPEDIQIKRLPPEKQLLQRFDKFISESSKYTKAQRDREWNDFACRVCRFSNQMTARDLARMIHLCSKYDFRHANLFMIACEEFLVRHIPRNHTNALDITLLLGSFARLGIRNELLFSRCESFLARRYSELQIPHLSVICHAYVQLGLGGRTFGLVVGSRLIELRNSLREQDLAVLTEVIWQIRGLNVEESLFLIEQVLARSCLHFKRMDLLQKLAVQAKQLSVFKTTPYDGSIQNPFKFDENQLNAVVNPPFLNCISEFIPSQNFTVSLPWYDLIEQSTPRETIGSNEFGDLVDRALNQHNIEACLQLLSSSTCSSLDVPKIISLLEILSQHEHDSERKLENVQINPLVWARLQNAIKTAKTNGGDQTYQAVNLLVPLIKLGLWNEALTLKGQDDGQFLHAILASLTKFDINTILIPQLSLSAQNNTCIVDEKALFALLLKNKKAYDNLNLDTDFEANCLINFSSLFRLINEELDGQYFGPIPPEALSILCSCVITYAKEKNRISL